MRSFTSVSDKIFLVSLLFSAAILALFFYYIAEGFSETMLMEKKNWRIESLRVESGKSEFALIGTSHAGSHLMPAGIHYINLTGGHNLPPAMYYEAKALLKYTTPLKAVYIEADDHIFMNGPAYNIKKSSGKKPTTSSMYETWGGYFDEEGKYIFGGGKEKSNLISSLFLQPDVKPILLKRIIKKITRNFFNSNPEAKAEEISDACKDNIKIMDPNTKTETYWSRIQGEDRERELMGRLGILSLDKPSPIDPLMTEYYEKTIHLFLDKGIQVILTRFPMSPDFQQRVHPENTAKIQSYIDNLRIKNNLPILDISYLSQNGDKFFENEDHVHKDFFSLIGALIVDDFCKKRRGEIGPP